MPKGKKHQLPLYIQELVEFIAQKKLVFCKELRELQKNRLKFEGIGCLEWHRNHETLQVGLQNTYSYLLTSFPYMHT